MSRPSFGPRLQPHVHARLTARSCLRWRRAAGVCHAPTGVALALVAATLTRAAPLAAQQPTPPPPSPQIAPYKLPVIALVQPPSGGMIPQDKPVVVLRFAQGESADPIDLRSFAVTVDGTDRTNLFQLAVLPAAPNGPPAGAPNATGEAWGSLAPANAPAMAVGAHQVSARICSSRGACGETNATVLVAPAPATSATADAPQGRRRVLTIILDATRWILGSRN